MSNQEESMYIKLMSSLEKSGTPTSCVEVAYRAAKRWHEGQKRKYTDEDYIVHPLDVAIRLNDFCLDSIGVSAPDYIMAAALLHDVVEDTEATYSEIQDLFDKERGSRVTGLVYWLTDDIDVKQGNRFLRKRLAAEKLGHAPMQVKIIKYFDLESNKESISLHDSKFYDSCYRKEFEHLLEVMGLKYEEDMLPIVKYALRHDYKIDLASN